MRAVSGQNLFLVTDTAPIRADIGCAAVPVQAGLFGVQCRALPGSGGTQFRSFSVNGGGGDRLASNDLFAVPAQDSSIDKLHGFDGTDYCRIPLVEPDITVGCEIIDKD